ncbi:bifunctional folylpolyglutamate synthase/dihydrofolate synthase [Robiginitomaculum antarcticum]|uniref:bifunctional folylpolyglutamate synthase/dihydrofolate synthase n=1 Tax=Robiginitomaculum antarcticum TaxID=437507 RepID=UPI00035FFFCB|nr:folylpolyglutamate synthase/dihydrofolate synthase family protein [Robiginitomaculum antarcticum]
MNDTERAQRALDALTRRHPRKIDLGLERIENVLKKLGNPQHSLPPCIHIAGTNGKGSTAALLRAMAEAQGLSVHVYTSPHLVKFNERIVLAGAQIDDGRLAEYLERVTAASEDDPLTFFEATTAAAYLAFHEAPADLAIIEVGLGGRYDATNVITPVLSLITPIDYDHAEFLGRDLSKIAREKAGIIKRHVPVMIGPQSALVSAVLHNEAQKNRAPITAFDEQFRAYPEHGRLVFEDDDSLLDLPMPALIGAHQIQNAALAIAAARHLKLTPESIAQGLQNVKWPARLQPLTSGPLAELARKGGTELWLDGGHNPHAARVLAAAMADLEARDPRPLVMIMGILSNKNAGGFLDEFEGLASALIAVDIQGHAGLSPDVLAELARGRGLLDKVADNLTDAVKRAINIGQALSRETPDAPVIAPRILICGSLYLAGQVLAMKG